MSERIRLTDKLFKGGKYHRDTAQLGKHSVGHWTVWQKALAKAERLDPWLADFIAWTAWWEDLRREREKFLSEHHRDEVMELRKRIETLEHELEVRDV